MHDVNARRDAACPRLPFPPPGQLAGLETVRLIREPVAAGLAYGLDLKQVARLGRGGGG
jgi:hypothetical protein